jgi:hypothetical protein
MAAASYMDRNTKHIFRQLFLERIAHIFLFLLFDGLETVPGIFFSRFFSRLVNPLIVANVQATKRLTASHHVERHQDCTLAPSNGRA